MNAAPSWSGLTESIIVLVRFAVRHMTRFFCENYFVSLCF